MAVAYTGRATRGANPDDPCGIDPFARYDLVDFRSIQLRGSLCDHRRPRRTHPVDPFDMTADLVGQFGNLPDTDPTAPALQRARNRQVRCMVLIDEPAPGSECQLQRPNAGRPLRGLATLILENLSGDLARTNLGARPHRFYGIAGMTLRLLDRVDGLFAQP